MVFIIYFFYYLFYPFVWWGFWIWRFRRAKNPVVQAVIGAVALTFFLPVMLWDVIVANVVLQDICKVDAGVKVYQTVLLPDEDFESKNPSRMGLPIIVTDGRYLNRGEPWKGRYVFRDTAEIVYSKGIGSLPVRTNPTGVSREEGFFTIEVHRHETAIVDAVKNEVLGLDRHYTSRRVGPPFWRQSARCPEGFSNPSLASRVFLKETAIPSRKPEK